MNTLQCKWHTCTKKLTGRKRSFCSSQCKNKYFVDRRRKKLKELAVNYKGGQCFRCGYNRCIAALEFHHTKGTKDFGIASSGVTRSWASIQVELDKCVCVCANCHREIHSGLSVP